MLTINFQNVKKYNAAQQVLENVTFELNNGEKWARWSHRERQYDAAVHACDAAMHDYEAGLVLYFLSTVEAIRVRKMIPGRFLSCANTPLLSNARQQQAGQECLRIQFDHLGGRPRDPYQ